MGFLFCMWRQRLGIGVDGDWSRGSEFGKHGNGELRVREGDVDGVRGV